MKKIELTDYYKIILTLILYFVSLITTAQKVSIHYDNKGRLTKKQTTGTLPSINIVGDSTACKGGLVSIHATGATAYQWNNGSNSSSISVVADSTRTYKVVGYNTKGCADTAYHLLKVIPPPTVGSIAGKSVVFTNAIDTFSVPFTAGAFYNWSVTNGIILDGNGSNILVVQWNNNVGQGIISLVKSINPNQCKSPPSNKTVDIIKNTTSITELIDIKSLNVYPNPSSKGTWVDFQSNPKEVYTLSVTDIGGKEVYSNTLQGKDNYHVFLNENIFSSSGIYIIKIASQAGNSITRRFNILK